MRVRKWRVKVSNNLRSPKNEPVLGFGIRLGYWPCIKGYFIDIAFATKHYFVWHGLPSRTMDQEKKAKWVAALKSGEFKQGVGWLKTRDGRMCCLGVLCEVYRRETGKGEWTGTNLFLVDDRMYNHSDALLPEPVREWAGLPARSPSLPDGRELVSLNDTLRLSFDEIADVIEKDL